MLNIFCFYFVKVTLLIFLLSKFMLISLILIYNKEKKYFFNNNLGIRVMIDMIDGCIYVYLCILISVLN